MTTKSQIKSRLLASVGTTVLASMIASGAYAAETNIPTPGTTEVVGHSTLDQSVTNDAAIGATVSDVKAGVTVTGTQTGTSSMVTDSFISAKALANTFTNSIDLETLQDDMVNAGAASLGVTTNKSSGVVTTSVATSTLTLDLTGFVSGTAVNNDNTIEASTTVNAGSTSVAGTLPIGYQSTTKGSSTVESGAAPAPLAAAGSIVASSFQENAATGHAASLTSNTIGLTLNSDLDNDVGSSPTLDGNTMSATLAVNAATTTIGLEEGWSPAFEGTAVANNVQSNAGSATASNTSSQIAATVEGTNPATAINTLEGGLSVKDNAISSSAFGNKATGSNGAAGNQIVIGDTLSVAGAATATPGAAIDLATGGELSSAAAADFIVHNSQTNANATAITITSTTASGGITADVQQLESGSIAMAGNDITSQALGNSASSAVLSGDNAPSFDASVAVANAQNNTKANVVATTSAASVTATTGASGGETKESTVSISANRTAATAFGNDVSQTVALEANTINSTAGLVALTGGTSGTDDGNITATGALTVSNLQTSLTANVTATNSGSTIGLQADTDAAGDTVTFSQLSTDANRQEALALGSNAGNTLSLTGNAVASGAGVANVQIGDANSKVSSTLSTAQVRTTALTNVTDSTLSATGNLQRAIGYGTMAGNTLSVSANAVDIADAGTGSKVTYDTTGMPFNDGAVYPAVSASFGVLNDQTIQNDVTAAATGGAISLAVQGKLTNSGATNDSNALVAAAYGTDATNGISLDVGTLSNAAFATAAQVTSVQSVVGADVSATASGVDVLLTDDDVASSSVSTSANQIQALANGGHASNTLDVSGITIDTNNTVTAGLSVSAANVLTGTSSFGVTNAQSGSGTVSASLLDSPMSPTTSATVMTTLGAAATAITSSTIASDGNALTAEATSNRGSNELAIDASVATTTGGLQNFQATSADVTSLIGIAGVDPAPNSGGVTVSALGDTITNSAISVSENRTAGSATGNSASNSLSAAAGTIGSGSAMVVSGAQTATGATATSDYALSNVQDVAVGGSLTSTVLGTFAIQTAADAAISGATLSVSDNAQRSAAVANTASSAIDLSGGTVSAGTALVSKQTSAAAASATSDLDILAPAAVSASSIDLSGNTNTALSVQNDATNSLKVSSTTIATMDTAAVAGEVGNAVLNSTTLAANADHALLNDQSASATATVQSTAETHIANSNSAASDTSGLVNSAFSMNGNATYSEASVNRATNTLTLNGGATQGASGGVLNRQSNLAAATAETRATVSVDLAGDSVAPSAALSGSSVALNGNSSTALARGNVASNALNAIAGANYNTSSDAASASASAGTVAATSAMLNIQDNGGAVSATNDGSAYVVALNAANSADPGATNGSVLAGGNSIAAGAYGNSAVNRLSMVGLSTGTSTAALASIQSNTGAVTASVTNAMLRAGSTGVASGTSFGVSGNSIAASAIGNSVSNAISRM